MQKLLQHKHVTLGLAAAALAAFVLLTNALGNINFLPSQPIGWGKSEPSAGPPLDVKALLQSAADIPFWKQLMFWAALFLCVLLITSLLSPEVRKQLIRVFLRTASFALILLYLLKKEPQLFEGFLGKFSGIGQNLALPPLADGPAEPVFTPPPNVSWLSFAIGLGLMAVAILLIWWANRVWSRIRQLGASDVQRGELARIARISLEDLKSGRNYENAIVECYDRMSDVIAKKQGLQREGAMTPSEFSARLMQAGLPRDPIQKLTHLFESVRYGRQIAGMAEINEAINSLTAILAFCGETAS